MTSTRVALACIEPELPGGEYTPFSFGPRRVHAALLADPRLDVEVTFLERIERDPDSWVETLEQADADVVGLSGYVWSFPTFVEVARRLKRSRPERRVVLGGPSAHPAMFQLAPFADAVASFDALVTGEGEAAFADVLHALGTGGPLEAVPGVALPTSEGFRRTAVREPGELDSLASPTELGLIPPGRTAAFESFRGCPLSCAFCQWGDAGPPSRVFSEEYLTRELAALRDFGAPSAQNLDAALNLSSRAFRNLAAAEKASRYFEKARMFACVYPSHLNDDHLAFLGSIRRPRIDIGLQSFNEGALDAMGRPFSMARFRRVVTELAQVSDIEVELILGLPGDSLDGFRKTLAMALELPAVVRVFHCMVLPEALLTRSPASFALDFDPYTLAMRSCLGWSPEDLRVATSELEALVLRESGEQGMGFFQMRHTRGTEPSAPIDEAAARALTDAVLRASPAWRLGSIELAGETLVLAVATAAGPLTVELRRAGTARSLASHGGVEIGYRPMAGRRVVEADLAALRRLVVLASAVSLAALTGPKRATGVEPSEPRRLPVV